MQEKRILYALLISFLFLWGYSTIIAKFFPKAETKSAAITVEVEKEHSISKGAVVDGPEREKATVTATVGKFDITCSPTGGYIDRLRLKEYEEELLCRDIGFSEVDKDKEYKVEIRDNKIIFFHGQSEKKEYIFQNYTISLKRTPSAITPIVMFSMSLINNVLEQRYQEFFYAQQDTVERMPLKKVKQGSIENIKFIGARDRYFCITTIKGEHGHFELRRDNIKVSVLTAPVSGDIVLYAGPQSKEALQDVGLEAIRHYGFFHPIGAALMKLLYFFYGVTKNWGVSVLLLAVGVYFFLFPFTMKSTKAMKRMQELQPEIEALKQKHKDNPQKMNKEMLAMYREYKINPLGGCLPLVFQFPVFIALYQVLLRCIELKGKNFLWIKDLALPDQIFKLPFSIPFLGNYINLLPILIIIISLFQQKFTTAAASAEQKKMGLFFAVFIGVIFYNFPASLVLYWFVQNLLTLVYQIQLSRQ